MVARAKDPVGDPERYVLTSTRRNPESWAPDAARWRTKGSTTKTTKQKADKALVARFRAWASKQPPCEHGQHGGDLIGPDGIAPCPLCRQETCTESAAAWSIT